jgi:hypothetical protein
MIFDRFAIFSSLNKIKFTQIVYNLSFLKFYVKYNFSSGLFLCHLPAGQLLLNVKRTVPLHDVSTTIRQKKEHDFPVAYLP